MHWNVIVVAVKDKNRVRNMEIELLNAVRNPIQEVGLSSDISFGHKMAI